MPNSKLIYQRTRGSLGENEDWWYLETDDDGARQVRHEWSYTNAYKAGPSNSGESRSSVDEFLAGDNDQNAKRALEQLLNEEANA